MSRRTANSRGSKSIRGIAVKALDETPGRWLVLPTPSGVVYNPGITTIPYKTRSLLGELVTEGEDIDAQEPTLNLTFPTKTLETVGMRLGKRMEVVTDHDSFVERNNILVRSTSLLGAKKVGQEGWGMVADQSSSEASVINADGLSVPLTRQPYVSFNSAIPLSFAQGSNGDSKWSDDIIADGGSSVSYTFPVTAPRAVVLSENPFLNFAVNIIVILRDLSLMRLEMASASVKLDEGNIDFGSAEFPVTLRANYDGSQCLPINFTTIDQLAFC